MTDVNQVFIVVRAANGWPSRFGTANALSLGVWHHLAITYKSTGLATIYFNGTYQASNGAVSIPSNSTLSPCYLGKAVGSGWWWGSSPSPNFDGDLDEIKLFNRALNQTEVVAEMAKFFI